MRIPSLAAAVLLVTPALARPALAEIAVTGNDGKRTLVGGVNTVVKNPRPDTLSVIDLSGPAPRLVTEIEAPHSVVGPPNSIAVSADEGLALATSAEKLDPADPAKTIPDNRVSVVDLRASPPRVTQTLEVGLGPSGVSINRAGTLALVANRMAGTVSVLRIEGGRVSVSDTVTVGLAATGASHAQFTPDGRHALVTRDNDSIVSVLEIKDGAVTKLDRDMTAGVRPYGISITPGGGWAVVGNVGRSANNTGDQDTVSLVDLSREPFRVMDTVSVGTTVEGVMASPDGRHAVAVVHNGTGRPTGDALRGTAQVRLLRIEGGRLQVVGAAGAGDWVQGMGFSRDGRTLLIGNMADRTLGVYRIEGNGITDTGQRLAVSGGPAAIGTAAFAAAPPASAGPPPRGTP